MQNHRGGERCCALVLAAIVIALTWHDAALASCGDYVLVRDAHGKLIPASQFRTNGAMASDHESAPSSLPCHGPRCSRLPSVPPAAPLAPLKLIGPPEGSLAQVDAGDTSPGGGSRPIHQAPATPMHHPGRIFRPPRF